VQNPTPPEPADYTALDEALDKAAELDKDDYTEESWADLAALVEEAEALSRDLTVEDQDIIDEVAQAIYDAIEALVEQTVTPPVKSIVNAVTTPIDFISIIETAKNSRVWVLTFNVTLTYSDGSKEVVKYSINLIGNNANLDGKHKFGADHKLAGYTLTYDIKGNGSNIKEFKLAK